MNAALVIVAVAPIFGVTIVVIVYIIQIRHTCQVNAVAILIYAVAADFRRTRMNAGFIVIAVPFLYGISVTILIRLLGADGIAAVTVLIYASSDLCCRRRFP